MPEKECACCAKKKHTPRDEKQKKDLTARIAKIQGQLKGIASMIEEERSKWRQRKKLSNPSDM